MSKSLLEKIPSKAWAYLLLLAWGGAILGFGLINLTPFGLDEGAAMALLLNWSVVDQVVNPVTTYGGPDFRALLFIPLGLYWSGSILAAKVFSLIVTFGAAMLLYRWARQRDPQYGDETALIATGLLLIAPGVIGLADHMDVGPYLIAAFGLGWILDRKYRASEHVISSLYFIQLLLVAIAVTLHPMGLAYPLALAWSWYKTPKSPRQRNQVWIGIGIATGIILAMQTGWIALQWMSNPFLSLSLMLQGLGATLVKDISPIPGIIAAAVLALILLKQARTLLADLFGTSLLLGLLIGLLVADVNWAFVALVLILYCGTPLLIRANVMLGKHTGFVGQRGLVMAALLVTATLFMQGDKAHALRIESGLLSPSDELIQALIPEATDPDKHFLAASQWPARTMLVVRADVLPLPPAAKNGEQQLAMMKGLTHIIFNHNDPDNSQLARNFREITSATITLARQPGGVILKLRDAPKESLHAPKPAKPLDNDTPEVSASSAKEPSTKEQSP
ncbi:MAG TPA: hypothetical protein ENI97_05360 [Gammaproteobacteria bacterium]|nr:hypothetical protein [Gammaproteobacteria bacterium]